MISLDINKVLNVVETVQEEENCIFTPEEVVEVYLYTIRKCRAIGKDKEYFYILLEDELRNHLVRSCINNVFNENRKETEKCVTFA